MAWWYLISAGLFEIVWTSSLESSGSSVRRPDAESLQVVAQQVADVLDRWMYTSTWLSTD